MKAEIIAIGSELTCGARIDTNSVWLSQELAACGWTVQRHTTVADDQATMVKIFQDAAARSQIVLVTGGLGPTQDDITRHTLAEAFGQRLVQDDAALQHIQELFRSRNRVMPERNKVQALRPEQAQMIPNAHGTAPGILMHQTEPECTIAVMPGVPAEMKLMFQNEVRDKLPKSPLIVERCVIKSFGMGESDVERCLGNLTARGRNPEVGITASEAVISLSITAIADRTEECVSMLESVRQMIHDRLGTAVYGEGEVQLQDVVIQQLTRANQRIALLEGTTTGGMIGQWMTESEQGQQRLASGMLYPSESALLNVCEATASQQSESVQPPAETDWRQLGRERAHTLLQSQIADYVLVSSPSHLRTDSQGISCQVGQVLLVGQGVSQEQDVSMTGNLVIFRQRASRTALNLLRLHLLSQ